MEQITCRRCGNTFMIALTTLDKRKHRDDVKAEWCNDCRGSMTTTECRPWSGDVDLDSLAPIKADGSLHMPGVRLCGRTDCVAPKHVIQAMELERIKPAGFTGTIHDLWEMLQGELPNMCKVHKCHSFARSLGMCERHYMVEYRRRNPKPGKPLKDEDLLDFWVENGYAQDVCNYPNCGEPHSAKGLCHKHYVMAYRRTQKLLKGN